MNKKILIIVGILILVVAVIFVFNRIQSQKETSKTELLQKYQTLKTQYEDAKAKGYDVAEAEEFARKAKQAYDLKDYAKAKEFLDKAFEALEKATPQTMLEPITSLKQVKVASLYESLTNGVHYLTNRSTDDVIYLFKETKTDFVFRTWWRFHSCPESPNDSSGLFTQDELEKDVLKGYTYEHLKTATSKIKQEMPNLILCGAVPAQFLWAKDKNDVTGEVISDTSSMALNPQKWGINQPIQRGKPDITNPEFQKLLLSWAEKQIDVGTDAIWIDLLFTQAESFKHATGNPNHPSVKESYEAASKIVDEIHNYGYSKYGKHIYVGTWAYPAISLPYTPPKLDFVTQNVMSSEVLSIQFNNNRWDNTIKDTKSRLGDIPVLAVLDWASGTGTGLGVFSQTLTSEQQKEFLRKADDFFTKKGIIFVYPVHGGFMGEDAKILAYGISPFYDSLAPEFRTYETIKELALKKSGAECIPTESNKELSCSDSKDNDCDGSTDCRDSDCSKSAACRPSSCDKCGFLCTADKCHNLGQCHYTKGWIYGKCSFCTLNTQCSDYKDQKECGSDPCGIGCEWKNNKCAKKQAGVVCGNRICESGEDGNSCPQDCCVSGDGLCRDGCTSANDNDCKMEVKVETICTDGIDNDGDGLIDNEDGDCWIRDGAVFMEDFEPVRTFKNLEEIIPDLISIGIKTIETLPLWDHPTTGNHGVRWAVRNYSKLDPERGNEVRLTEFIENAHEYGLKIVPYVQITGTFASSPACKDKIIAGNTLFYDKDGIGGHLYQYQMANPDKKIILKNANGQFLCLPTGWGFAVNQDSHDVIEFAKEIYKNQIAGRKLDGIRLDASGRNHCLAGEKIYLDGKRYDCVDPATEKHSPLPLYRELKNLKTPNQVFMAEVQYTEALTSDYMWKYPYYPAYPDMDEFAEASEGYEFLSMLRHTENGELTSSELVNWVNNQPILYNRQRFRMIRNWNGVGRSVINFVAADSRYYPAVIMAVTIPGIPKVSDYELFGNDIVDDYYKIAPTNVPEKRREHWKKVLNIRNSNNALKYGSIENLWKSGDNTYAYSRTYENETVVVVINFLNRQAISYLNLHFAKGTILKDELSGETFTVSDPSNFKITVPAYGSRILKQISQTTDCTLNSVSIAPQCSSGSSVNCEAGENIKVYVSYSGSCPSTAYIQIDAKSSDGVCSIQAIGGDMVGIQTTCTSGSCTGYWTIPAVAGDCLGKTVSTYAAGIWENGFPGKGKLVAGKTGSFGSFSFKTGFIPKGNLSQVKVASLYDRVTDGIVIGRSINDVINIFKETNTDLIFKDFIRWEPVPESSTSIMPGYPDNYVSNKAKIGYTYEQLRDAINQIKAAKPNTLFLGGICTQRLNRIEFNDVTHEMFTQSQTWDMAFDPTTINLNESKLNIQCKVAKALGWISSSVSCPSGYDPLTAPAYFPDITNSQYQELLLSRAKKQIDLGADAIWIDMLFGQASAISEITENPNHPAVKESYEAASKIVDDIHTYGTIKYNRHIYVGTWPTFTELPYTPPALDYVTASLSSEEITGGLNETVWDNTKALITEKLGNIPIFSIIDWGGADGGVNMPLTAFSQTLTPAQQREFLITADAFFKTKGIVFVYPVHGGTFPTKAKRLSFGRFNVYDSLAPEFQTYETIKELAQKKASE